ncbi:MAG: hypothetical protein KatS3mg060_3364 [Dehalococcoidia bacterium]|nr:MAG: hypothetical protein KatS3mg060_3364 [Dehalococcoidia bacterium]
MTPFEAAAFALLGALSVLVAGYALRALSAATAIPEPDPATQAKRAPVAAIVLGTSAMGLDRQAASVTRVEPAVAPPPGWSGRNWALAEAARAARADWLLITTDKTVWQEGSLAGLVAFARGCNVEVVTLFGRQEATTAAERAALPVIALGLAAASPLGAVNDPARPNVALAFPECLLIRRSAWEAIDGLRLVASREEPWFELARLVKASGRPIVAGSGRRLFSVAGGRNWSALCDRWARLIGRVTGGRGGLIVAAAMIVLAVNVLPFAWLAVGSLGLLLNPGSILWTMCGAIGLAQVGVVLGARRWIDRYTSAPAWFLITHPLGGVMVVAILLEALRRSGTTQ